MRIQTFSLIIIAFFGGVIVSNLPFESSAPPSLSDPRMDYMRWQLKSQEATIGVILQIVEKQQEKIDLLSEIQFRSLNCPTPSRNYSVTGWQQLPSPSLIR